MLSIDATPAGRWIQATLDSLARLSDSRADAGVTRLPFSKEHGAALEVLDALMRDAGLDTHRDAAATLIGRRAGPPGAPTLLIGSHQDSIRRGGRYDGILGIVLPIAVLQALRDTALPFAIEILAFADEEGVRFPTALMGPRCLAGTFDPTDLTLQDEDGISLGEALAGFGGEPGALPSLQRDPATLRGYLEVHIEQGPVLEQQALPVGVVTGICGIERWQVQLEGRAGHAGTVPMDLRQDALCGAAEIVTRVESLCRAAEGVVGVVGRLSLSPNVVNAIPGQVSFSIELRAADDAQRHRVAQSVEEAVMAVAAARSLACTVEKHYAQPGVLCDPILMQALAEGIGAQPLRVHRLMSGATHDASAMADLCPVAMLFVRCVDGVSHHPDESVSDDDLQVAADTLAATLLSLADADLKTHPGR